MTIRHDTCGIPRRAGTCCGYIDIIVLADGRCDASPIFPVEGSTSSEVALSLLVAGERDGLDLTLDQATKLADCIRDAVDNAKGYVP